MGRTSTAGKSRPRDAATKVAEQRLSVLGLARELGNGEPGKQSIQ